MIKTTLITLCALLFSNVSSACIEEGVSNKKNFKNCIQAAENNEAEDQYNLATLYYKGLGTKQNYQLASEWCIKAVEQNHAQAQYLLAKMYQNGTIVIQDSETSLQLYLDAANNNLTAAQLYLARIYFQGDGVEQSNTKAHMWSNIAAISGNQNAINMRNDLIKILKLEEIKEAQAMARKWTKRNKEVKEEEVKEDIN